VSYFGKHEGKLGGPDRDLCIASHYLLINASRGAVLNQLDVADMRRWITQRNPSANQITDCYRL
jgi:hypothetical protein